ncbi:hypothetical protein FNF28_01972 [Cafeteria roenbergensis]|uniref:tRNA/rRNA methyltransferase SpoU type domain-containing protein n=1 Tax=Cafeteria roenbergensis TaxID=33653 RepID=A0A5A8DY85_CAFRO|nr:hypothetical protein FNF28_01972 [Cafeteria roenbergensis]
MNQADAYRRALERNAERNAERERRRYEGVRAKKADEQAASKGDEATRRSRAFYDSVFAEGAAARPGKRPRSEEPDAPARREARKAKKPSLLDVAKAARIKKRQTAAQREADIAEREAMAERKRAAHKRTSKQVRSRTSRGQPSLGALSAALLERVVKREGGALAKSFRARHTTEATSKLTAGMPELAEAAASSDSEGSDGEGDDGNDADSVGEEDGDEEGEEAASDADQQASEEEASEGEDEDEDEAGEADAASAPGSESESEDRGEYSEDDDDAASAADSLTEEDQPRAPKVYSRDRTGGFPQMARGRSHAGMASAVGKLAVALLRPAIPQNTGAIGRLCLGYHAPLHLVKPMGFELTETRLKRAGLDYWKDVDVHEHESTDAFFEFAAGGGGGEGVPGAFDLLVGLSAPHRYGVEPLTEFHGIGNTLRAGGSVCLVLGSETHGMEFLSDAQRDSMTRVFLPMSPAVRSLNLATCAGIALFEAARQAGFTQGQLEAEAARQGLRAPRGRWEGSGTDGHR